LKKRNKLADYDVVEIEPSVFEPSIYDQMKPFESKRGELKLLEEKKEEVKVEEVKVVKEVKPKEPTEPKKGASSEEIISYIKFKTPNFDTKKSKYPETGTQKFKKTGKNWTVI
jgi:hypothetical protein